MTSSVPMPSGRLQRPRARWFKALAGLAKVATVLACGGAMGLAATAYVLDRQLDPASIRTGAWTTWLKAGTRAIDPYTRAIDAKTGAIPMAAAEGLVFLASVDDTGVPLSARCAYRVSSTFPAARAWTLAVSTSEGLLMENAANRSGFTSREVLRREDGSFDVTLSPTARPGNWLPLSGDRSFVLALRLYDTPLTSVGGSGAATPALPALMPLGCPP